MKQTVDESKTLKAYNVIAATRADTHSNSEVWRDVFEKFRKLLPSGKILDVGCAVGRDVPLFQKAKYGYVGIDFSWKMIEKAKGLHPEAQFLQMDMYDLDFAKQSFDGFWAVASLLHIPKKNVTNVLEQIKYVTKPKGYGVFIVKEGTGEKVIRGVQGEERFFAFYEQNEFKEILEKEGFTILEQLKDFKEYDPPKNLTIWLVYLVRKNE